MSSPFPPPSPGDSGRQVLQFAGPAREYRYIAWQGAQRRSKLGSRLRHGRHRCRWSFLAGRVQVIRQAHPAGHRSFLHGNRDRDIHGRRGGVPDDLLIKPGRDDDRQDACRAGKGRLQVLRVQQPERQVDRGTGYSMFVIGDLPGVQGHPQADRLLARMLAVVIFQRCHQRRRQRFGKQALGYLGRDKDEYAVAAVLVITAIPRNPRTVERLPRGPVEPVTDLHLLPAGTARIAEPLNVDDDDGPVNSEPSIHLLSPLTQDRANSCLC